MRYLGGKTRLAKEICSLILKYKFNTYVEPFCGSCAVGLELLKQGYNGNVYFSDLNPDLIQMWIELQNGWKPPQNITQEEYENNKKLTTPSALKGFTSFACSWGAKPWGGYARGQDRNYCKESYDNLLKHVPYILNKEKVKFYNYDFYQIKGKTGILYYLDPPYMNTTGYKIDFDYNKFWDKCFSIKNNGGIVIVSEFNGPEKYCIWQKSRKIDVGLGDARSVKIEKIFAIT